MYKPLWPNNETYRINESTEGETIETRVERIMNNNEPITDGAPIIYTARQDGVPPETNIRSDRFEIAIEGHDKMAKERLQKRQERQDKREGKQADPTPDTPTK